MSTYTLRTWDRKRDREVVTATWLRGECELHRYQDVPTQTARWWLFRCLDATLAAPKVGVVLADPVGVKQATPAGLAVFTQYKGDPHPTLHWIEVEERHRRHGLGRALLDQILPVSCRTVGATSLTMEGLELLRATRPGCIPMHNPFVLWQAGADAGEELSAASARFRKRLMRAMVHAGYVPAHGNSNAKPLALWGDSD